MQSRIFSSIALFLALPALILNKVKKKKTPSDKMEILSCHITIGNNQLIQTIKITVNLTKISQAIFTYVLNMYIYIYIYIILTKT